ncbi:MAG: hypothetical protein IJN83_05875 [Clostridia bacterium]|nr:hypothetical protein [Clostridia bacterium]
MADAERQQLINRFEELADRADRQGFWTDTEFLTLAQQDILCTLRLAVPHALYGGYPGGERKIAAFGSEELCGCPYPSPIVCVKIAPASQKFADQLTHRDFLGALMGLGVRREVMGDILISDNTGYLFCLGAIAPYIMDSLAEVKRTTVRCSLSEPPTALMEPPPISSVVIASERLDAIISAVYQLSRSGGKELIQQGRVFINSRLVQSASAALSPGALISVRGKGRFIYEGIERETKKGRLRVRVRIY